MSEQLNLWTRPSLNPVPRVKEAMRKALKNCPLSREQVVDRMNDLARTEAISTNGKAKRVTSEMLDKWVAVSGEHIIPWKLLPIFCLTVGDNSALTALAAPLGVRLIDKEEADLLEWAKVEMQGRKLRKRKKQLEERITI